MFVDRRTCFFQYIPIRFNVKPQQRHLAMPMVYIECPVTGNLVATNYILPDLKKLQDPVNRNVAIPCEYCNGEHIWNDENGFFLGDNAKKKTT